MKRLVSLGIAAIFLIMAVGLTYLAYRRIGTPVQLIREAVTVDGVITEKLIQQERLSPLPLEVNTYIVRYAFPNPEGQMRTGQQTVSRGFYRQVGEQGSPVEVIIYPENPATNAVDAWINFPGVAGWRLGAAGVLLGLAFGVVVGRWKK